MKLPFDLGVKLFFRLLLPGFLLTLGISPLLFALLDIVRLANQNQVAFVLTTILVGWLILAADMPIYMLLEGRRYWPDFLRQKLHESEQNRLCNLNKEVEKYCTKDKPTPGEYRRCVEAYVETLSYPIGNDGERIARSPTRLGNTIDAFETYSDTRYELEAIFYWPRIWINLNKDLREEIDNQQAMADSAVYSSFALACAGIFWVLYGVFSMLEGPLAALVYKLGLLPEPLGPGIFPYLPGFLACFMIGVASLLLSYVVYRLAVFINEQFGAVFMAVIDGHFDKVNEYVKVDKIVEKVSNMSKIHKIHASYGEKLEITRRYLQYYVVELPNQKRAVPFSKVPEYLDTTKEYSGPNLNQSDNPSCG
jgi:hypothetical protein